MFYQHAMERFLMRNPKDGIREPQSTSGMSEETCYPFMKIWSSIKTQIKQVLKWDIKKSHINHVMQQTIYSYAYLIADKLCYTLYNCKQKGQKHLFETI